MFLTASPDACIFLKGNIPGGLHGVDITFSRYFTGAM
jgi:hypothetical protein